MTSSSKQRPTTAEAYVRLIDQAIVEVQELRASMDYDVEDEGGSMAFLEPLERDLTRLRQSMRDGSYFFHKDELPFMVLVRRNLRHIPFAQLLAVIDETHRLGLDIDRA